MTNIPVIETAATINGAFGAELPVFAWGRDELVGTGEAVGVPSWGLGELPGEAAGVSSLRLVTTSVGGRVIAFVGAKVINQCTNGASTFVGA